MARQGKPWDLMAWSFSFKPEFKDFSTKHTVQLKQEAAMVLALGGGFQAYFMQKPDGSIVSWQIPVMKELAEFCRARQEICHGAEAVPKLPFFILRKLFTGETQGFSVIGMACLFRCRAYCIAFWTRKTAWRY